MSVDAPGSIIHRCFLGIRPVPTHPANWLVQERVVPSECATPSRLYTWKARGSVWATIRKGDGSCHGSQTTVHLDDTCDCFLARECCRLPDICPPGTEFLGQFIFDEFEAFGDHQVVPVFMASDITIYNGQPTAGVMGAEERYSIVRSYLGAQDSAHQTSCIRVQWAGERESTLAFCSDNANSLPHHVEYVYSLSDSSAFTPIVVQ